MLCSVIVALSGILNCDVRNSTHVGPQGIQYLRAGGQPNVRIVRNKDS